MLTRKPDFYYIQVLEAIADLEQAGEDAVLPAIENRMKEFQQLVWVPEIAVSFLAGLTRLSFAIHANRLGCWLNDVYKNVDDMACPPNSSRTSHVLAFLEQDLMIGAYEQTATDNAVRYYLTPKGKKVLNSTKPSPDPDPPSFDLIF